MHDQISKTPQSWGQLCSGSENFYHVWMAERWLRIWWVNLQLYIPVAVKQLCLTTIPDKQIERVRETEKVTSHKKHPEYYVAMSYFKQASAGNFRICNFIDSVSLSTYEEDAEKTMDKVNCYQGDVAFYPFLRICIIPSYPHKDHSWVDIHLTLLWNRGFQVNFWLCAESWGQLIHSSWICWAVKTRTW